MVKFKVQVAILRALLAFLDDATAIADEPAERQEAVVAMVDILKKNSEGLPATQEVEVEMPADKFVAFGGALRQIAVVILGAAQKIQHEGVEAVEENG